MTQIRFGSPDTNSAVCNTIIGGPTPTFIGWTQIRKSIACLRNGWRTSFGWRKNLRMSNTVCGTGANIPKATVLFCSYRIIVILTGLSVGAFLRMFGARALVHISDPPNKTYIFLTIL